MTTQGIIKRNVVKLKVVGANAIEVQEAVSAISRNTVPNALESVFSDFGQEHLLIDRIELDLERLSMDSLEHDFVSRLKSRLHDALSAAKCQRGANCTPIKAGGQADLSSERMTLTAGEMAFETLRHFLKTGAMPWWAVSVTPESAMEAVFGSGLDDSARFFADVFELDRALLRAVCQYGDNLLQRVACLLRQDESANIAALMRTITEMEGANGPSASGRFRIAMWCAVFFALDAREMPRPGLFEMMKEVCGGYAVAEAARRVEKEIIEKGLAKERFFAKILIFLRGAGPALALSGKIEAGINAPFLPHSKEGYGAEVATALMGMPELEKTENKGAEFFIKNAGAVILWAYLERFFGKAGLLSEKQFKDTQAGARAVHLLEYLATGNSGVFEDALPLNKLLCGVDLAMPVPREFAPTPLEAEEAQGLLSALISHWSALKNTSIEGLRAAFILRQGILTETEGGYLLRVERKPHDILLEKLPWGISLIRLPWMTGILRVEW